MSCSHSVFSSPFSGCGLIFWLVSLVDMGNLWDQRIIWIGVSQQGADGKKNLGDGECWWPLLLQDVQTDWTIGVDVWMVDPGCEVDLCGLEWVIGREMDIQEIDTSRIWRIFWTHNGSLPVILILLVNWTSRAVGGWIFSKINEFLLNSLDSRHLNFISWL